MKTTRLQRKKIKFIFAISTFSDCSVTLAFYGPELVFIFVQKLACKSFLNNCTMKYHFSAISLLYWCGMCLQATGLRNAKQGISKVTLSVRVM